MLDIIERVILLCGATGSIVAAVIEVLIYLHNKKKK